GGSEMAVVLHVRGCRDGSGEMVAPAVTVAATDVVRWLLWIAAAAMVVSAAMMERSGGAWWRVMDLIDRVTRSHFGVFRKISSEKLSGGGGGGRRRLPKIG
nr:hypothetical protein [Tanacetum cinerariifolium]